MKARALKWDDVVQTADGTVGLVASETYQGEVEIRLDSLPVVVHYPYDEWPDVPPEGIEVDFRLVYDGSLPSATGSKTRNDAKNRIRRVLAKQLRELWTHHPRLRKRVERRDWVSHWGDNPDPSRQWSYVEMRAQKYQRCGRFFCPLISNDAGVACEVEILFLRRDQPGNLIESGGDIDNRIKVLFDALRMPGNCDEIDGKAEDDDNPFFCLLEDDRLITDMKVTTDRLLTPLSDEGHINDVHLVIHVRTIVFVHQNEAHMWLT